MSTTSSSATSGSTTRLRDGRLLGYAEYGDPAGKAIFHFHGSASSRMEHPADEAILTQLGIRFISTDRPGHGLSDPQPGRNVMAWPDDIRQLADHLGVARFYITGLSAGGTYALACAHQLPQRVLAGAVIDGGAPPDGLTSGQGLTFQLRLFRFAAQRLPAVLHLFRRQAYLAMKDGFDASSLLAAFPPAERQLLEIPQNLDMLLAAIREGYRQGWQGIALDDIIIHRPWGFRIEDISVRMDIWHGGRDNAIPLQHGQYLHQRIPHSRLTVWPGQGHVAVLAHWGEVLAALVEGEGHEL